jgi:hypothetical protein
MRKTYQVPVQVASIEKVQVEKIVYNFSVEQDESYYLNGILSHNCRCRLAPIGETVDQPEPDWGTIDDWLEQRVEND